MHILVVEDSATDQAIYEAVASRAFEGTTVEVVPSLEQARRHVADRPVDAVLLDLGLPDSAGAQTVRAMRDALPTAVVFVMTSEELAGELVQACMEMGADDVVSKADDLMGTIGRLQIAVLRAAVQRRAQPNVWANHDRNIIARAIRDIHHETKTPLQVILTDIDALEALGDDPVLRRIRRNAERLRAILREFAGEVQIPGEQEIVDLADYFAEYVAGEALEVVPGPPARVILDPVGFAQGLSWLRQAASLDGDSTVLRWSTPDRGHLDVEVQHGPDLASSHPLLYQVAQEAIDRAHGTLTPVDSGSRITLMIA